MGQLDGRIALVTGGGRGVGRAISELLAAEGAIVAVNYARDEVSARATVDGIVAAGGRARAFQAAVEDPEADTAMVEAITAELGVVDLLVNNAGIASRGRMVADTDAAEVARVVGVHAFGPHHLCRLLMPAMRTRPRGDVVFISSVATTHMGPYGAPYNMGKAAMEALARTLAKEERTNGIHVNVVAPGLVDTDMGKRLARATAGVPDIHMLDATMPFGHVCTPQEVAAVVLFVCSDAAAYLTGQRIEVDGGGPLGGTLRGAQ